MTRESRLWSVLILNLAMIACLGAVGLASHSLGVLAAAGDYTADAAAIGLSLLAITLRHRPPTVRRPRGYPRATAIAALVNGSFLLAVAVLVTLEGTHRLVSGVGRVHGLPVVIASGIAAIVMVAGALILQGDERGPADEAGDAANMRAVLLDTIADAAAAGGAAAAGAVIAVTGGLYWLDPAVAIGIAAFIGYHVIGLLRDAVNALRLPHRPHPSP